VGGGGGGESERESQHSSLDALSKSIRIDAVNLTILNSP